ncbi:MAG: Imm26 family immunity protein [Alistipes sp.]|nr:Imm26 family immunity protein [Alistipes sp.]
MSRWKKRYEKLSDSVKKELDNETEFFHNGGYGKINGHQLRVIKRTRKYPQKGDVFVFSPRDEVYFYGIVANSDVTNHNGDGMYVVMLFKNKTKSLDNISFVPDFHNLITNPLIVTRLYWTKGYFYNVMHIDELKVNITYGFYHTGWDEITDEYDNKLENEPQYIGISGVSTDVGVAYDINTELIIHPEFLQF